MEVFRMVLSILSFLLGCYLIIDLVFNGFNWPVLVGVIAVFILANFLWPKERKVKDSIEDSLDIVDLLEILVTLPFRAISFILRSIVRVGKEVDDIDL